MKVVRTQTMVKEQKLLNELHNELFWCMQIPKNSFDTVNKKHFIDELTRFNKIRIKYIAEAIIEKLKGGKQKC